MLPDLVRLLRHEHPPAIRAYARNHGGDEAQAGELFQDMLRYLWASRKHRADRAARAQEGALAFTFVMHEEMRAVDDMWHTFILYTQDYTDFCRRFFGENLHHQPDVAEGDAPSDAAFEAEMERYLSYVYDVLGEDTVRRWFRAALT